MSLNATSHHSLMHPAPPPARAARGDVRERPPGIAPRRGTALLIGAGVGGLAAAVRLALRGFRVTVVERQDGPGGRVGVLRSGGFTFDTGPSLVMMAGEWHRLFRDAGRRVEDYLTLVRIDPCYRIHFPDGAWHDRTGDLDRLILGCEALEPGCGPRLREYLGRAGRMYSQGLHFIGRNMHRLSAMAGLARLGPLGGAGALGDLRRLLARHFRDQRLRDSFSFQTLYLGLSPFAALAVYSLLGYSEIADGIYYPLGGMHQLALALERLAKELGVGFRYGDEVERLERRNGTVCAAVLRGGERLEADTVVVNADLPYAYQQLLGDPYPGIERKQFSCSAVLLYLGVNRTYPHLRHHNFLVGRDFRAACADLFDHHRMPEDPPVYLMAPSRTDPGVAPPGCESLVALVLAPSQPRDRARWTDWTTEGPRVAEKTLDRLEAELGLSGLRGHLVVRHLATPQTFTDRFGNLRGEAFGLSHNLRQIGWFRPHNRHARLRNLYFVGQSTHPGCGLPMVLISARCVAERVLAEQPV
jgi:phytoene desaturase